MRTKVLRLSANAGMFANVNEVVNQLNLAERNEYQLLIRWDRSLYNDNNIDGYVWNYFFEDCFKNADPSATETVPYTGSSTDRHVNIMRPRLYKNIHAGPMLMPVDRLLSNRLISKYIKLKPNIAKIIEEYKTCHFSAYVVGLHLRGPGRLDGGTKQLKNKHKLKAGVPFELYFEYVDRQIQIHPEAKVFLCSDSEMVINECKSKYGDALMTYESTRSYFGEMHAQNREDNNMYSGYKLGEDVIVEAYLLSKTDYLIHGNSNVSNFVLCLNPDLKSSYVYEKDSHSSLLTSLLDVLPMRSMQRAKRKAMKKVRSLFGRS